MGVCDIPVISNVCDTVGEGAATLVEAPFNWLASGIGATAGWIMEAMWTAFDATTLVDVTQPGYVSVYNLLFGVGVFIVLLFFGFQLILGLIKRDPSALARAALGAAKAVLGSFVVLTLTALTLETVDQLCIGIVHATGETMGTMGDKIMLLGGSLGALSLTGPGIGAIITIFLGGLMIAAVAIVWFSLLIRKALLLVAIVFAPIAFAGSAWDVTRGWVSKWMAFVIALIVSKLVLVVVFLIAVTQIATPIELELTAITEPVVGIVLMFIAAFAPYMVYRFVSFLGFDMYHAMGSEQDAKNAMNRPVPLPSKGTGDAPKKVLDGSGDKGGSAPASAPSPAPAAPAAGVAPAAAPEAGASAASAAAAGPAAAVVVGAEVVEAVATAGPKIGGEIGAQAAAASEGAEQSSAPSSEGTPSPAAPQPGAPGEPAPAAPAADPPQPAPPVPPASPRPPDPPIPPTPKE